MCGCCCGDFQDVSSNSQNNNLIPGNQNSGNQNSGESHTFKKVSGI